MTPLGCIGRRWAPLLLAVLVLAALVAGAETAAQQAAVRAAPDTIRQAGEKVNESLRPYAFVAFLYGNYYALPVRVMMQSLRLHQAPGVLFEPPGGVGGPLDALTVERAGAERAADAAERPHALRVVLVTRDVSEAALDQLHRDGLYTLQVEYVQNPYEHVKKVNRRFHDVMAKLQVFALEQFEQLVYLDADTLVLGDMHDAFQCGDFCATFINPCHFNSGVMVIKPSRERYRDMLHRLATTESYDGGDQGFLNVYFARLYDAPAFHPGTAERGGPMRRLPFGYHLDHIVYYPRMRWDIPERCGGRRAVEFMGIPYFKPWQWWTYPFFDLSWEWYWARRSLRDPHPPDHHTGPTSVLLRLAAIYLAGYSATMVVWRRMAVSGGGAGRRRRSAAGAAEEWLCRLRPVRYFLEMDERVYLFAGVFVGMSGWVVCTLLSVASMPMFTSPHTADLVYVHTKALLSYLWMLLLGVVCSRRHRLSDAKRSCGNVWLRTLAMALADALAPPAVFAATWRVHWSSIFQKIAVLLLILGIYLVVLNAMYAHLVVLWARLGASLAERDRARSKSLQTELNDTDFAAAVTELATEYRSSHSEDNSPGYPRTGSVTPTEAAGAGGGAVAHQRYQYRSP